MPVIKQAIKKVRQDKRKTVINLKVKTAYKNVVRTYKKSPSAGALSGVFKALDKAAKTSVIHKNKASRLKSRLSKALASSKKQASSPKKTTSTAK